uniref:Carbamoyl phosphate synthase small chain n=1 Tax=Gronococcus sybilensis TaxID=3028029 RepID=A0A9Y1MXM4_9RHOD|nr:carbamoyl-phosphate synthase arginine-specific small subunit [Gronococcus sybilensis]
MINKKPAMLVLENGKIYRGWSFSENLTISGEIVFNTGMTGYEEIITDPSYKGQIVSFTYTEIGNTGINYSDQESSNPTVSAIILKNLSNKASNWRSKNDLVSYLNSFNIIEIHGIDTRALTRDIRNFGAMKGTISNENFNSHSLSNKIKSLPSMEGANLISSVSTKRAYEWSDATTAEWEFAPKLLNQYKFKVVVIDFGVKFNILRRLKSYGCNVIVVSSEANLEEILSYNPDGIVLSNGPGDPSAESSAIYVVGELLKQKLPIFGICMGHQLLNLAMGATTFKLKFGHRGVNHPSGKNKRIEITSQNHGFAVDTSSLNTQNVYISHINLNDHTVAGMLHTQLPVFSVQYHPEASPGPHDSEYLFSTFLHLVEQYKESV